MPPTLIEPAEVKSRSVFRQSYQAAPSPIAGAYAGMAQVTFSKFPTSKHVTQETTETPLRRDLGRCWVVQNLAAYFSSKAQEAIGFSEIYYLDFVMMGSGVRVT